MEVVDAVTDNFPGLLFVCERVTPSSSVQYNKYVYDVIPCLS